MRAHLKKSIAYLLAVSFVSLQLTPVYAGMVGTQTLVNQASSEVNRDRLKIALKRAHVRELLASHGVTVTQAQERIDALTDQEVSQLAGDFDDKAGGQVLEILIIAGLVVVILELVGITDIFAQF
jgi:hypothetical protein